MDQARVDLIVDKLGSASVQERYEAIQEAYSLFTNFFKPNFNEAEWAKAALTVEMLYNLLRDELKQKQIRINRKIEEVVAPVKSKAAKPKATKLKPKTELDAIDFDALADEFMKKRAGKNENTEAST